jgi:cytochrome c oxidase assembly factor 4
MGARESKTVKPSSSEPLAAQDDEEDEYITRIKKSGCYNEHVKLQDCYWDTKDWRKCKEEMKEFKACFTRQQKNEPLIQECAQGQ